MDKSFNINNWNNIAELASILKETDKDIIEEVDDIDIKKTTNIKIKINIKVTTNKVVKYDSNRKKIIKSDIVKKVDKDYCKFCKKSAVIYDSGNYVCTECGIEQGKLYSAGVETRYYGSDDTKRSDPTRTGAPINELLPGASLMPVISGYGREKFRELHKRYSMNYDERSMLNIINRTDQKLKNSGIPTCIIDKAKAYYKILGSENYKLRSSGDNFMAACVLYMCKKKGLLKTDKEIAKLFCIKSKALTKGVDSFQEIIFRYHPEMIDMVKPDTPADYIKKYCINLGLRKGIIEEATYAADVAKKFGLTECNIPSSIAVGCIYLVSETYKYNINRKMIFQKTGVSDVTILNSYHKFKPYSKFMLNKKSLEDLDEIVIC